MGDTKDTIECRVCHKQFRNITTHLIKTHGINAEDYKSKYPDAELVSDSFRELHRKRMKNRYKDDPKTRLIAGSRTFDFIKNKKLSLLLQRDYKSAQTCLKNKLWKPSIILYGSIIEAILREITRAKTFQIALEQGYKDKLISEKEYHKIHIVRDLRNFVHLHKELSEKEEINEYWAKTFAEICESFIKRFKEI